MAVVCRGGGKGLNECLRGPPWLRRLFGGHLQLALRGGEWWWESSSRPVLRFPAFPHRHISTFTGYLEHLRTGSPLAHTGVTQESLHWNQWC